MNILVIGNGFDLAHGLPTKYTDFLVFCKMIKAVYAVNKNNKPEDIWKEVNVKVSNNGNLFDRICRENKLQSYFARY